MDGGVGLRIMWRSGENRGRRNPLQCGEVYDTIAGGNLRKNDDCGGIGMSLKIELKNLGILKHAEFSLGDLTIICGKNNTGKTYAAYALYGFLHDWRGLIDFGVSEDQAQRLLADGGVKIGLAGYAEKADWLLADACEQYADQLDRIVFAATEGRFRNSEFQIQTGAIDIRDKEFKREMGIVSDRLLTYAKEKGSDELTVSLLVEKELGRKIDPDFARSAINFIIGYAIFSDSFPDPFVSSVERTGTAMFQRELNLTRNRLLEAIGKADQKIDPQELISKAYPSYPLPIEENVGFIRQLENIAKRQSFIAKEHPEVLEAFSDVIEGEYTITQDGRLYYTPKGTGLKLTMVESSSAVRSLVDIGFYLRHVAQKGDLLMVDEPELNLHPANQRRIARLFARLVNLGVKVFITTHSDYIVKELNTLIMLNHDKPHLKRIAEENDYRQSELICSDQVKVYMTQEALMPLEEGQKRRRRGLTLVEADVDPVLGIEAPSFDKTIDEMNRIQADIVWGAE